jgi:hypothetical protein
MRLCMFHPVDRPMDRGWVGRVDGDRVLHLAAQTLQAFFLGGGGAREHAEYPLDRVTLLVPVLYPPAVRVFDGDGGFEFANPAAVRGPGPVPLGYLAAAGELVLRPRVAAVIGAEGAIGGFALFAEWRAPALAPPKDRDFASALGPLVVTPDEADPAALAIDVRVGGETRFAGPVTACDWDAALALAAGGTELRPGDVLAGPPVAVLDGLGPGAAVEIESAHLGVLRTGAAGAT